jgi:ubiquinone/menaquinone biosynthesis C-methylase UbiE
MGWETLGTCLALLLAVMNLRTDSDGSTAAPEILMGSVAGGLRWGVDRMVSLGYGLVYDYIFERFTPYQSLRTEMLDLVKRAAADHANPREFTVLDVGCGTGNFTFTLAEAGFLATGIDPYDALVELAREKRRAMHVPNLAFRQTDLAKTNAFRDGAFDQVVNIHSLYVHPDPDRLLAEAFRILKPGGHAIFVNFTRRVEFRSTWRDIKARFGLKAALACMLWVLPNAVFEAMRRSIGPHYWSEEEFSARLRGAGFTVLEMRRTFFDDASVLAWARKDIAG